MKTISIINLKGGVGKTVSSINIADVLTKKFNKRVLLIDNDKQGNTSKFFGLHSEDRKGIQNILVDRDLKVDEIIFSTNNEKLDIITANMNLLIADRTVLMDTSRIQQTRLKKFLEPVKEKYDFCIIDNAPDINMSVINALAITDDVLIPIKIDKFSFDGLSQLLQQIEDVKDFNPQINLKGCFVTMYQNNNISKEGNIWLNENYKVFNTYIRHTVKVNESTFFGKPLLEYAKGCTASVDYINLVKEYIGVDKDE